MNVSFDTNSVHPSPNGQTWRGEASIKGHKVTIELNESGMTKESAEAKMKEAVDHMASAISSKDEKTFQWGTVTLKKDEESPQEVTKKRPARKAPQPPVHAQQLFKQTEEVLKTEETFNRGVSILDKALKETLNQMKATGHKPSRDLRNFSKNVELLAKASGSVVEQLNVMNDTQAVERKLSQFNTIFSKEQISDYYSVLGKIVSRQNNVREELKTFFNDNPDSLERVNGIVRDESKPSDNFNNYLILPAQRLPRFLMYINDVKKLITGLGNQEIISKMDNNIKFAEEKLDQANKAPGRIRRIFNKIFHS